MAKKTPPIRVEIPEELQLSEREIDFIQQEFLAALAVVQEPGEPPLDDSPINTTRLPVEIRVVSSLRREEFKATAEGSGETKSGGETKG